MNKKPAHVKFTKPSPYIKGFTSGKIYEAYFVEYWQGKRNSLHVRNDSGEIVNFIPLEAFEIIDDENNLLNFNEAVVKCISHDFDDELFDLNYGNEYIAIGRDKNGMYLVKDESCDCYFYEPECFEIVEDIHGILKNESVYYSYQS